MTVSILATTDNGDPAFGLKQGTLARERNLLRGPHTMPIADRLASPKRQCSSWRA